MLKHVAARAADAMVRPVDAALTRLLSRRIAGVPVDRPIFIVGVERSGTTLLYSLIANHRASCWLSRLDDVLPRSPLVAAWLRRVLGGLPGGERPYLAIPGTVGRSRGRFPPSEGVFYWKRMFGWGTEEDYRLEDDRFTERQLTPDLRERLVRDTRARLLPSTGTRMVFKQPGFSLKLRFLDALFPDARYLHCVRRPADNLRSLVAVKRRSRERLWGIKFPGWRDLLDAPPEVQAAQQLRAVADATARDAATIDPGGCRYRRLRYEDLLQRPEETLRDVLEFCGLDEDAAVMRAAARVETQPPHRAVHDRPPVSGEVRGILDDLADRYGYSTEDG